VTRPNLLFLSHRLPWPPHNGAAVRSWNLLRQLSQEFDIIALCFDRRDAALAGMPIGDRADAIAEYASCAAYPIEGTYFPPRFLWDHIRSVASGRPYVHYVHDSTAYETALRKIVAAGRIDLVHLDSLDLLRFVPLVRHLPISCNHHNAESVLLERRAAREGGVRGAYIRYQAGLLARREAELMPTFALNLATSDVDARLLHAIAPRARIEVISNGVDIEHFRPALHLTRAGSVFVGGTTWYPNLDGLSWLTSDILPAMRTAGVNGGVTWVGRVTDAHRAAYAQPEIQFTGYVDDIRPHVQSAACFIAPLRVGGGTRLKLLDAWAMGAPVVATRLACEGLQAVDGENILLADDPQAFVGAMARVMSDRALSARLGSAGRLTAERTYSWDVIGKRMRDLYLDLAGRRRAVAA
jgi:glycosyltransferase involved in cell wall biosynthesis